MQQALVRLSRSRRAGHDAFGRRQMALLPGLPFLLKAAAAAKKAKVATSWLSAFTHWRGGHHAKRTRTAARRVAGGATVALGMGCGAVYASSQDEILVSGRRRLLLTTREEEMEYADECSEEIYREWADKCLLVTDLDGTLPSRPWHSWMPSRWAAEARNYQLLEVAQRLVKAVLTSTDLPAGVDKLRWRLHLIDDETLNAFVLPNGHIYVFTGVLKATPSADVLAFLLGHECAHAVLRHGGEAMSHAPFLETAALVFTSLLAAVLPIADGGYTTFQALMLRLGLSVMTAPASILELAYSREHETEADQVGVLLAARACFDPYHAQYLFHCFGEVKREMGVEEGSSALLSTHPLDKDREDAVRKQVRQAMHEHRGCGCKPVDVRKRRSMDKQLGRPQLRSLTCHERSSLNKHREHTNPQNSDSTKEHCRHNAEAR